MKKSESFVKIQKSVFFFLLFQTTMAMAYLGLTMSIGFDHVEAGFMYEHLPVQWKGPVYCSIVVALMFLIVSLLGWCGQCCDRLSLYFLCLILFFCAIVFMIVVMISDFHVLDTSEEWMASYWTNLTLVETEVLEQYFFCCGYDIEEGTLCSTLNITRSGCQDPISLLMFKNLTNLNIISFIFIIFFTLNFSYLTYFTILLYNTQHTLDLVPPSTQYQSLSIKLINYLL